MLPPPISLPFSTRSYAWASTVPGSSSMRSMSASMGEVNGWCIATHRPSSALHSRSGKSVTHVKTNSSGLSQPLARATERRIWPRTFDVASASPHASSSRSASPVSDAPRAARNVASPAAFSAELCTTPPGCRTQTRPPAPSAFASSASASSSLREDRPPPGTTMPRTTPPAATASRNTLKVDPPKTSDTSAIAIPTRRSGLSDP